MTKYEHFLEVFLIPLPKAILFDLDDTIVSYHPVSDIAWVQVCQNFILQNQLCEIGVLLNAIKEASKQYWSIPERHRLGRLDLNNVRREFVTTALHNLGCTDAAKAVKLADAYSELHQEMIQPFPGALETLDRLAQQKIKLALVTNGNAAKQRYKINKFMLERYFQVCLVEGEVGFGKPDARIFRMALDALEVTPGEAWMVGDNLEWDIEMPRQMGLFAIWNDYSRSGLSQECKIIPDRIIHHIGELLE